MAKRARRRGLRSQMWFYKQCLLECDRDRRASELAWDVLMKGVAQQDSTRGHVGQAIGAVQEFFRDFPHHRTRIADTDANEPYNIVNDREMLEDWLEWLPSRIARYRHRGGRYGRQEYNYNINRMRTYLPPRVGGRPQRAAGGAGLDEFKKVLRLMAEFWDRK